MAQRWLRCSICIFILALLLPFVLIAIVSQCLVEPQRFLYPPPPSEDNPANYGLPFEVVSFPSYSFRDNRTSVTLSGWWIPAKKNSRQNRQNSITLVAVHGALGDKRAFLRQSKNWYESGYSILLFNCQTSYKAEKEYYYTQQLKSFTFGILESDDVLAAVRYAHKKGTSSTRVVVVGQSNGAASVIVAAATPESLTGGEFAIDAVISEAPFASPKAIMEHYLAKILRGGRSGTYSFAGTASIIAKSIFPVLFPDWLLQYSVEISLWRFGCVPERHFGNEVVSRLSKPLFLIHGTSDQLCPLSHSEQLYERAKGPKELWIVPNGQHLSGYDLVGPAAYHQRFNQFIRDKVLKKTNV